MEEIVSVNVIEAGEDLVQNALDAAVVQVFVISCLHELIQITIHVFHTYVKLLGHGIKEDLEGGHKVGVVWEGAQENDLS